MDLDYDAEKLMEATNFSFKSLKNKKVIVVLNTGNPMEVVSWRDNVDAIIWAGYPGELAGDALLAVVSGEINPSAKLTITWPEKYNDTPAHKYFPGQSQNAQYYEDVYVGYRYFETFAKDKVRYPFGYGLSYTTFSYNCEKAANDSANKKITLSVKVTNSGKVAAKESVQIYVKAPCGNLGKADKVLVDFEKTSDIAPSASQSLTFEIPYYSFASYDDSGVSGHKSCYVLEKGSYTVYAGSNVRSLCEALTFELPETIVIKECEEACVPAADFFKKEDYSPSPLS